MLIKAKSLTYDDDFIIVQFAKEPVLGAVKTRLTPTLSQQQALNLHCSLVTLTFNTIANAKLGRQELWVGCHSKEGNATHDFFMQLVKQKTVEIYLQQGSDLGERMYHAAKECLQRAARVVIVGSDCPFIDANYLASARQVLLAENPVVIGPANDGGYVLIGFTQVAPQLFAEVTWGSAQVLAQTRNNLHLLGWSWSELTALDDIDRPEDLRLLPADVCPN